MTTFLLLPGAGGDARYWYRLVPELERLGHVGVPVDLPQDDESYDWVRLTDVAVAALHHAVEPRDPAAEVVVVAQSMGAFVGPLVCAREPVRLLVLLNPMIPSPGETGADWWDVTEHAAARVAAGLGPFDPVDDFFHDVPPEVTQRVLSGQDRAPSGRSFADPWPATAWPDVPTVVLQGRDDRLFPPAFQRRVAHDRLGLEIQEMPGGHLVALSRPADLAVRLDVLARGGD